MEGESGVTRSVIDELHSCDINRDQVEGENGLTEVSLMNLILGISEEEIKWKVKVMLLQVLLMNFIFGISKEIKWKVEVVLPKVSLMNFILRMWSNGR